MDNGFFRINGAEEIEKGLKDLSRGLQNKILRPGMRKGAAEVRKKAKALAPVDTGIMKKSIKSKVFTIKTGAKGVSARIGVLYDKSGEAGYYPAKGESDPRPIALVAASYKKNVRDFLEDALQQSKSQSTNLLIQTTQQKLDEHWSKY